MKSQHNWMRRLLAVTSLLLICAMLFASCNAGGNIPTDTSKPADKETDEGNDQTEPHVHEWSDWTVTTEPTCTTYGKESRSCACGEVEKRTVEAKGHDYTSAVTKPTATENAYITYTCDCGHHYVDSIETQDFAITAENRNLIGYAGQANENLIIPAIFEYDGIWYRVTYIGQDAFSGCSNLTGVAIPDTVTYIAQSAFINCANLESIMLPFIGSQDGGYQTSHLGYIFGAKFGHSNEWYVPDSLKTVVITSATNIGESAFSGCSSLTSVTIPNSVISIGRSAFSGCSSLTSINIPDSVKSLGLHAFSKCSSLTNITIPDGVTNLTSSVFYGCSSLTNITIPNTVTFIAESTFEGCTNLTNIRFEGTVSEWKHISFEHIYLDRAWNTDVPATEVICSDGVVKLT